MRVQLTGWQNYYGNPEEFTCVNCIASINVGPSIYGQREGVVCGTCEEPLGIKADHAAALREEYGRKLLAEEDLWFKVENDHAEALDMEINRNAPRYIGYVSTGLPGDTTPGMMPVATIREAVDYLRGYSERTSSLNGVTPSLTLYTCMFDVDMWRDARDFSDVGTPFNYPSYILTVGARGGVKVERA